MFPHLSIYIGMRWEATYVAEKLKKGPNSPVRNLVGPSPVSPHRAWGIFSLDRLLQGGWEKSPHNGHRYLAEKMKLKGYSIPSTLAITKKLTQQYVVHFRMFERVGKLVYRLDIPVDWRIHNVFMIAQLEPAPNPASDPFNRPRFNHPDSVYVEGDTEEYKSFEIG